MEVLQSSDMKVMFAPPWSSTATWTPWLAEVPTPLDLGAFGWTWMWVHDVSVRSPSWLASTWSV